MYFTEFSFNLFSFSILFSFLNSHTVYNFFLDLFCFMCKSGLPVYALCVYVQSVLAWCLQNSLEGMGSPETGVRHDREPPCVCAGNCVLVLWKCSQGS